MLISSLFYLHFTSRKKKEFPKTAVLVFSRGLLEMEDVWVLFLG